MIYLINKFHPFLISLQETWLRPDLNFKVTDYSSIREDRIDGYGGVAILINHSVPYKHIPIPQHSNDISIIAVNINEICFVSLYIPHPSSSVFNEIELIFSNLPKPIIVMGDLNAQHVAWGSSSSNHYGSRLLDIVDNLNLCLLNTGKPTRRTLPLEGVSAPDLSICSPNLASSLTWTTMSSTFGSDHYPISISFATRFDKKSFKRSPRQKYKLNNADWCTFKEQVEQNISSLPDVTESDHNLCAEAIASLLIRTADDVFPKKSSVVGIPSPPWWDQECSAAIKKRKEAEKRYKLHSTTENFDVLAEIMTSTRKLIKRKKWEGWKVFCSSLAPDVSPSTVWNNIRRFRTAFKESTPPLIHDPTLELFIDNIAPPFVPQEEFKFTESPPVCLKSVDVQQTIIAADFSLYELKGVLTRVKDSAPGSDGIPYSFISHLSDSALSYILNLINSVVKSGNIPPSWKSQEIIPILKPFKPSSDPSSYRPIALSSVLAKLAEHLVKNRLEWYIESKGLLSQSQYGFRKGKSTMDSLSIITTDIRIAFSNNESVLAAFLDIKSAYDNVILPILKQKLITLHIPAFIINFVINMLSERSIHVSQGNDMAAKSRLLWKGLPQGSVLSPLLYNIYTYDLESSVTAVDNFSILQYADDLLFYVSGRSIAKLCSSLSYSLTLLKTWLDNNGLTLSVNKCSTVLFSRMRLPPPISVRYDNLEIPMVKEAKFLGVILDAKLSGLPHCYNLAAKCERSLNIIRCLSGVWWGAHPFSLKLIYNALIRSVLDYGTYFLEPCSVLGLSKLDGIQSKSLRMVTGAMRSSPINALQVECCDPPLAIRRQFLCDKFLFRALQFVNHPLESKLKILSGLIETSSYWSRKKPPCLILSYRKFISLRAPTHRSQYFPIFCNKFESLVISPVVHLDDLVILKNDTNANSSFNCIINNKWPNWHYLYSDASKHSPFGHVGVGVYHSQFKIVQKVKLPPETTVFTGECYGILKSLEYALIMKLSHSVIFSDSKSALQALIKFPFVNNSNSVVILECRNLLCRMSLGGLTVHFAWIPGHHNIKGNVKSDILANEAITSGDIYPYKIFPHDLLTLPIISLRNSWEEEWASKNQHKGRHYRNIQSAIPTKPWFFKISLSKSVTSCIIRMRLGHACTPVHLSRLKIKTDDLCECGAVGDLNHIVFACPLHNRSSFLQSLVSLRIPFPTSVDILLSMNDIDIYNLLALYIMCNNIKL